MIDDDEYEDEQSAAEEMAARWEQQDRERDSNEKAEKAKKLNGVAILSKAEFIQGFVPPDYLIDGMLQRRFIYALTGQTGHAKTAVALLIARQVSMVEVAWLGRHRVTRGRVLYFVGENPDDVRMRVIGADANRKDDVQADQIWFIPGVFDIAAMRAEVEQYLETRGHLSLIIVDTSAAYFPGNDEVSNTQMGAYARMLRSLTLLPGGPTVLVLCHPIKYVQEPSQLLPRGGGAYLAEMDGNLTLWRTAEDVVELYYNKMRGPGFQPITFRLEQIKADALVDTSGRQIGTVQAVYITAQEEEQRLSEDEIENRRVLAAMLKTPGSEGGSFRVWAEAIGWFSNDGEAYKKRVERVIGRLFNTKPRLAHQRFNKWELTDEGKEKARNAAVEFERIKRESDPQNDMQF
jgi:hypothetical protein